MSDTDRPARPRPGADRFPTVAQAVAAARRLVRRHPGRCRLRQVGVSRGGRPLVLLSVGRGPRHVLVVGGPHPNEPSGVAGALRIAREVLGRPELADGRGVGWHFLLCLDPDGAALNVGWLHGPPTMARHFEHFHRPAFEEQPEWLPPAGSGREPMPETRALLRVIDELRPFLQVSLHGVDFGGTFLQLTRGVPGLAARFAGSAARAGVPLDVGTYDALGWPSPAPGTYLMPPPEGRGGPSPLPDDPARSTWSYPGRYGGVTALLEAPMWAVDAVGDGAPHADPRRAVHAAARSLLDGTEELAGLLERVRRYAAEPDGPAVRFVEFNLGVCPGMAEEWRAVVDAPAGGGLSVSRVTGLEIVAERIPLRVSAALLRLLAAAGGAGAERLRARVRQLVEGHCKLLRSGFGARWVPVRDQVDHHARSAVAAFECLV
ncbi:M14 family zinc carboxypeptidase [Kitasatospora indigofera]|uniref:M14 family zinc carboxypeptidase n=1 Tax=Kitasatospora indigofera TaxID=67307 RepID=UPI003675E18E